MTKLLCIAAGGALGSVARYGVGIAATRLTGSEFPWGTFAANALGCLFFGILAGLIEYRIALAEELKLALMVGFLGAFTTFSTYAFHTGMFMHEGQWWQAAANIALNNVVGIALFIAGFLAVRPWG